VGGVPCGADERGLRFPKCIVWICHCDYTLDICADAGSMQSGIHEGSSFGIPEGYFVLPYW